jgi:hypothetical protein
MMFLGLAAEYARQKQQLVDLQSQITTLESNINTLINSLEFLDPDRTTCNN